MIARSSDVRGPFSPPALNYTLYDSGVLSMIRRRLETELPPACILPVCLVRPINLNSSSKSRTSFSAVELWAHNLLKIICPSYIYLYPLPSPITTPYLMCNPHISYKVYSYMVIGIMELCLVPVQPLVQVVGRSPRPTRRATYELIV